MTHTTNPTQRPYPGGLASMSDTEKGRIELRDELRVACPSHTTEKKLMWRIDYRLVPWLVVLYLLAFLDRVNIANARSFGLTEDLKLSKLQYNTALTIFFVPYVLLEIPSNILMKKLSPRVWLSGCMIGFGLVTLAQGFVRNFAGIMVTRFLLGVFECGMFPGCFYLLSMWYRRHEAQRRYSLFFSSTSLAGAFGGLLAYGLGQLHGRQGMSGWRWIFIIEGAVTVAVGLFFLFTFPSFPEQATWLKADEREYVRARLEADQGRNSITRRIGLRDVGHVLSDYRIWLGGLMYFAVIVPAYGYAYFSPTIVQSYGFSPIETQLRSVPPWACAFVLAMSIAYLSDKLRHRWLFAMVPFTMALAGFIIMRVVHKNLTVRYAALFLAASGCYAGMPIIICWFNMNLGGHHRRSIGVAWQIAFGNIGGIIATYSYVASDAPLYKNGHTINIGFMCLVLISTTLYALSCMWENKKKSRINSNSMTEAEKEELGDKSPDFKYLL